MRYLKLLLLLTSTSGCVASAGYGYGYRSYYVAAAPMYMAPAPYYYAPRYCDHVAPCAPDRMCCFDRWNNPIGLVAP